MTYLPPTHPEPLRAPDPPSAIQRSFGYLGYVLLFFSAFFAGVTAFMALILAYARRDGADPLMRSHWVFQIRIFWIAFALTLAGGVVGFDAMVDWARQAPPAIPGEPAPGGQQGGGMLIPVAYRPPTAESLTRPAAWSYRFSETGPIAGKAKIKGVLALILLIGAIAWTLIAPLFGALRLASGRPIGHSRA